MKGGQPREAPALELVAVTEGAICTDEGCLISGLDFHPARDAAVEPAPSTARASEAQRKPGVDPAG